MQRITSRPSSASRRTRVTGNGSLATLRLVVLLVLRRCSSSTRSTTPVPVLPTMPSPLRVEELVNSTVLSMSTRRPSLPMVLLVSTVDSSPPLLVSSSTVVSTLVSTIRSVRLCSLLIVLPFANPMCRAGCPCWCSRGFLLRFLLARLGCYHWCWSCFIPSRHYSVCRVVLFGCIEFTHAFFAVVV